jgi:hypothetical protein
VNPVAEHDRPVERETGLRAIPRDEFADRVIVGPLAAGGREAVQDGCLGVFEVGQRQDPLFRELDLGISDGLLHRRQRLHRRPSLRRYT